MRFSHTVLFVSLFASRVHGGDAHGLEWPSAEMAR